MIADKIIIQDGQTYQPGEEVPDLGSISAIDANGNVRKYEGLTSDENKLKYINYVGNGSSATLYNDRGEVRIYHFNDKTKKWYRWGEGGVI